MDKIKKMIKDNVVSLVITMISVFLILLLDFIGIFQTLELKALDFAFGLRGPTSGWMSRHEIKEQKSNIVLVDLDDESYRLIPWTYPYPRGDVWAKVLENLTLAGAKVIVFDLLFDAPDQNSELLTNYGINLGFTPPAHGDGVFANAIQNAQKKGTDVILASKIAYEPTMVPPHYIVLPNPLIMSANPITGLADIVEDIDGFMRRYYVFLPLAHEKDKLHMTIGMKAVQSYLDLPDNIVPIGDVEQQKIEYGPLNIPTYGRTPTFLINFAGPPSGKIVPGMETAWKTFPRYPLSNILDVSDVILSDPLEDTDWMDPFIGNVPEWINMISDPEEKAQTMSLLGINEFDVTQTPFYNKIVIIGPSTEVFQDTKKTPFYNYGGGSQLTPGMETHANAIQTILDQNYISIYGGNLDLTKSSFWYHFFIIGGLSLIAMVLFSLQNIYVAGVGIAVEVLVFISIAIGSFTNDFIWLLKKIIYILPINIGSSIIINSPAIGESTMMPIIAPVAGIALTYAGNVFYKFIMEQKDKLYLKQTFGTYISPDLIDQMFDEKKEPQLGGNKGIHTAFFTDIQNFSSFSEKLAPEILVELLNEYLTAMTDILLKNSGTLDKYTGDGIVAFYGAPVPVENHEFLACQTAVRMQTKLDELREKWKLEGDKWPDVIHNMQNRIGINTGSMVTGNMGSSMRMDYTMMGNTVDIAARLESSAKQYGIYIQVSDETYRACKDKFVWRSLDFVKVVGKSKPAKVYELIASVEEMPKKYTDILPAFHEALNLYNNQKWDKAIKAFKAVDVLEDMFQGRVTNPSQVYISRCKFFKTNPPGDNWDGSWTLTKK